MRFPTQLAARLLLAVSGVLACQAASAATPTGRPLLDDEQLLGAALGVADQRLALMPAVAAAKWPKHLPVSDPAREAVVVHSAGERATRIGLPRSAVEQLLVVQIGFARTAEDRLFAHWDASGYDFEGTAPDLTAELRPQLDRLADAAIEALYLAAPVFSRPDFVPWATALAARKLPGPRWTDQERSALVAALHAIHFETPASAARAKAAGVLRIGTPGDYAPFSTAVGAAVEGSDVELAQALGDSLGLKTVFIHSSWRSLLDDLGADRFDIAVGGISVTPARAAVADFSPAIARSGKTAIGRCTDAHRLESLPAIDSAAVRVVVNPGGTNETFARAHLHNAQLVQHADNRTVFDEILAGRADVMFTDETEVALSTHRHPELCRLLPDAFEPADKAFLMLKGGGWTALVNPWMTEELRQGIPAQLLNEYLSE